MTEPSNPELDLGLLRAELDACRAVIVRLRAERDAANAQALAVVRENQRLRDRLSPAGPVAPRPLRNPRTPFTWKGRTGR